MSFAPQAASWTMARQEVAKLDFHFAGLLPRGGLMVTHRQTDGRAVVRLFCYKQGTAEQVVTSTPKGPSRLALDGRQQEC